MSEDKKKDEKTKLQVFDNRELSWLKFNKRVLEEAEDKSVPLMERLSFASIFQSNLDEFFMVRVGSLYDQMLIDEKQRENKTNMTAGEQLSAIFEKVKLLEPVKDKAYFNIMAELVDYGVEQVTKMSQVTKDEHKYLETYFRHEVRPMLSPIIIDKRHPMPFLKNKDLYVVVELESSKGVRIGILPLVDVFSRIIRLTSKSLRFMLIEDLVLHFAETVFENYKVLGKAVIKVTRNADISEDEEMEDCDGDFRAVMEALVKQRKKLAPVRLQISGKLNEKVMDFFKEKLEIEDEQIFSAGSPLDLSFVYKLADMLNNPELQYSRLVPQRPLAVIPHEKMIPQILKKDILLAYPYESIRPFINLLNECATDPNVVSVKITLYRLAKNSQIIDALINIAESGKEVLVLVELRARFDEENNINWSKRLQEAGCTVIYGPHNFKVHSKLLLITRKIGNTVEYITQIGTGNYNEKTSTLYTDLSLMTANRDIGNDARNVFNALSLGNFVEHSEYLLVAPLCLQNRIVEMIDEEIRIAKSGQPAYVGAKINSLSDKVIIDKLIEASQAGVKIELIVRGICCLIAGVEGYTENISVTSIVGRYLEHSRIYMFGTKKRRKMYISSADYMTRNTVKRVEVAAPILDSDIKKKIEGMFTAMLADNVKARVQGKDGEYKKKKRLKKKPVDSQIFFYKQAYENAEKIKSAPQKKPSSQTFFDVFQRNS